MRYKIWSIILFLLSLSITSQENSWKYYSQLPPGNTAKLFAPGIIKHLAHSSPSFSPDGKEIYWSVVSSEPETRKILFVQFKKGEWSLPKIVSFSGSYHDDQPFLSYDGQLLFFASKRPKTENGEQQNDIWITERIGEKWDKPRPIDNCIGFWTPSVTKSGKIYFLEIIDKTPVICCAELVAGKYAEPECLNENINQKETRNWCPFIAKDESFLIFSSNREGGYGAGDLYISFKNDEGEWGEAINMGKKVNTDKQERFPGVSPDGKYLFFTRFFKAPNLHDLYWIDAKLIEDLKE